MRRRELSDIIEPRVEEIFAAVRHVIAESGFHDMLAAGAVITGGATLLDGMPELAESVLGLPARRGTPSGIGGLVDVVKSPSYATGVGLVKYGAQRLRERKPLIDEDDIPAPIRAGWGSKIGNWFKEVF
jgi:cell division protein FtsA